MSPNLNQIERWSQGTKILMFSGIVVLTLAIFLGSFWLFLVNLKIPFLIGILCVIVTLEIYFDLVLSHIIKWIKANRYIELEDNEIL